MQRQTIRDAELAVWQSGGGDRDVVFVHGFQNDHTAWRPLVQRLDGDRYRFTSFDLLGCGASGAADTWERCTIDEYGADLTALCDVLEMCLAVPEQEDGASPADLRRFLAERLPPQMVPSRIGSVDALPLAPSGKLDRQGVRQMAVGLPGRAVAGRA